jgi:hypothetical protein
LDGRQVETGVVSEEAGRARCQSMFLAWNLRLLDAFFSPAVAGEESWLQVDPRELDALAPDLGGDEGFRNAVRQGPPWSQKRGDPGLDFLQESLRLLDYRRGTAPRPVNYLEPGHISGVYAGANAPLYLPYLAALVRTAAVSERGFYEQLATDHEFLRRWSPNELARLETVWDDLERWTNGCDGRFGKFVRRSLGGYCRIGVPKSQSIVSSRDAEAIGRLFAQLGLKPGQSLSPRILAEVRQAAQGAYFLSAAFRGAAAEGAYQETLDARLERLIDEWDGSLPKAAPAGNEDENFRDLASRGVVEAVLSRAEGFDGLDGAWLIHWRVDALRDSGWLTLERAGASWRIPLLGTEASTSGPSDGIPQAAAIDALAASEDDDVEFSASVNSDGEPCGDDMPLFLLKRCLRSFVWEFSEREDRFELRERPVPLHGDAMLLATTSNAGRLGHYLEINNLDHELPDTTGLPEGWLLVHLKHCERLTEEQRSTMPDGQGHAARPRMLRLVGGRSVSRAGSRQYLPYDLPLIELDAPPGTVLCSSGLEFKEVRAGEGRSSIRRFTVRRQDDHVRSYRIKATKDGEELSVAALRVAGDDSIRIAPGRDYALDEMGLSSHDGEGLSGVLSQVRESGLSASGSFRNEAREVGAVIGNADLSAVTQCATACFLDALGREGSMSYGVARDLLDRLLGRESEVMGAGLALTKLRARGHLELEMDNKGRRIRVHAVAPALYPLAIECGGQRVLGIAGTLRLSHWRWLADELGAHGEVRVKRTGMAQLPLWRIIPAGGPIHAAVADAGGFSLRPPQSAAIADWSADVAARAAALAEGAVSTLGDMSNRARRYVPGKGHFARPLMEVAVGEGAAFQLFKTEDRETLRNDLFVLGIRQETGSRSLAFVRDSRWGIWIAVEAFGRFLRDTYGVREACPWPLPYTEDSGTVWIPGRLGLPVVLERALVLASGEPPAAIAVQGELHDGWIRLAHRRAGFEQPMVSRVYDEMATGTWLAYPFVPRDAAEAVASKLGARLTEA